VVRSADLASVPLFAELDEPQLVELAGWFEERDVSAGTRLTGEGAAGYSFYVLTDGAASVTAGGETIASLGPGDFFGEVAILGDGRRSATVTTTAYSKVLALFGTEFRRLQSEHPEIANSIAAAMRTRVGVAG